MLPCRDVDTDDIDVPDRWLRGASPQYEVSLSWLAKSAMSMDMTSSDAVRGPMLGTVSRPVRLVGGKQRRYLGGQRLYLGGVLRYPSREQPDGAVLAGDGHRVRPA